MIHLASLAWSHDLPDGTARFVLRPTTMTLPADRRLAVLGKRQQGKSVFLKLLAGIEPPTYGQVIADLQLSPVIKYGVLFHRRLGIIENIRFFARMMNLDRDGLARAIDAFCRDDRPASGAPLPIERRKAAEVALLSLLPFDCYLADEIGQIPAPARDRLFASLRPRGAGIIFSTSQPRLAERYADCAVVIRDGILHPFSTIDEAIDFHER